MEDSFAEVVEEVKNLSTEEKLDLKILIGKYLAEEKGKRYMKTIRQV
jgi:hypothetical protein